MLMRADVADCIDRAAAQKECDVGAVHVHKCSPLLMELSNRRDFDEHFQPRPNATAPPNEYPLSFRITVPATVCGSCSKKSVHPSSTVLARIFFLSSSVTSGRRSYPMM